MSEIEKWLTGVTVIAVVATIVTSPYSAGIFTAGGRAVAGIYSAAKH